MRPANFHSGDALKRKLKFSGRFALTSIAAAMLTLASPWASALGLGRLSVQSALGEAMQAEIEVTSMTAEEQANLRIRVAPPEAYRAANVDYNPVLPTTRATLQKRADGRLYVRLVSDRGVQEPFVDVILEISWATGRLVREYTLLFDPPAAQRAPATQAQGGTTTSPVISAAPPAATPLPPATSPAPSAREQRDAAAREQRAARDAQREAERQAAKEREGRLGIAPRRRIGQCARAAGAGVDEYRVQSGDTLSKIAGRTQRPGVSLDQMLVALFRANPSAFAGENMNRLKAGVVLSVPSAEAAQGVTPTEARKTIVAQSADFGAYRQKLAGSTLTPQAEPSTRQATGKVQASVDDKKTSAAPTPDKLTLSKGSAAAKPGSAEDKLAKEKERQAAEARVAELNKNLADLKKIQGATPPPAAAPAPARRRRWRLPPRSPVRRRRRRPPPRRRPRLHRFRPLCLRRLRSSSPRRRRRRRRSPLRPRPPARPRRPRSRPRSAATPPATASAVAAAPIVPRPVASAAAASRPAVRPPVKQPVADDSLLDTLLGNPLYLGAGLAGAAARRVRRLPVLPALEEGQRRDLVPREPPAARFVLRRQRRPAHRHPRCRRQLVVDDLFAVAARRDRRRRPGRRGRRLPRLRPRPAGRGNPQGGDAQQSRAPRDPQQAARGLRQAARHQGLRAARHPAVRADPRRGRGVDQGAGPRLADRPREPALSGRRRAGAPERGRGHWSSRSARARCRSPSSRCRRPTAARWAPIRPSATARSATSTSTSTTRTSACPRSRRRSTPPSRIRREPAARLPAVDDQDAADLERGGQVGPRHAATRRSPSTSPASASTSTSRATRLPAASTRRSSRTTASRIRSRASSSWPRSSSASATRTAPATCSAKCSPPPAARRRPRRRGCSTT